jgi:hypothetical protein
MLWAPASVVVRHRLLSTTVVTFFSSGLVASPCHQQSKCSMFLSVRFKKRGSGTNPSRCHCTALRRRCRLPFHRCAICRSNSDRWHLPLSLAASRQAATAFILPAAASNQAWPAPKRQRIAWSGSLRLPLAGWTAAGCCGKAASWPPLRSWNSEIFLVPSRKATTGMLRSFVSYGRGTASARGA